MSGTREERLPRGSALILILMCGCQGEPEGFAVDDARGLFYTNLEDKDRTLAIDLKTRQITKTW